jgi:hypothetical protein
MWERAVRKQVALTLRRRHLSMPQFEQYIGIDYSGANRSTSSLTGLRVYLA